MNFPKAAGLIAAQGPEIVGVRVQNHSGSPFLLGEVVQHQREKPPADVLAPQRRLPQELVDAKGQFFLPVGVVVFPAQFFVQWVDLDVAYGNALKLHQAAAHPLFRGVKFLLHFLRGKPKVPPPVKRQHPGIGHPPEQQGRILGKEGPHCHRPFLQMDRFHKQASFCQSIPQGPFSAKLPPEGRGYK